MKKLIVLCFLLLYVLDVNSQSISCIPAHCYSESYFNLKKVHRDFFKISPMSLGEFGMNPCVLDVKYNEVKGVYEVIYSVDELEDAVLNVKYLSNVGFGNKIKWRRDLYMEILDLGFFSKYDTLSIDLLDSNQFTLLFYNVKTSKSIAVELSK